MITEQEYIKAEDQYINLADHDLGKLVQNAADTQPALFVFVATYYDLLQEDDNKDFFLQVIYSTWIAYNNKYKLCRQITIEEVTKMDESEEKLLTEINQNEEAMIGEALKRITSHPQSELVGYLYMLIGDYFGLDEDQESEENPKYDAGVISGVINSFINLLEKSRQPLIVS